MTTSWNLTATAICSDALGHLGVIGDGQTPSAADVNVCLRALDAILKELPLSGYTWPKLSVETALTWSGGTPQTITLPANFYNYPTVRKTVSGQTELLLQISHAEWAQKTGRETTAAQPTHFYISPDKKIYFWPIPTVDPLAIIQYQKIVDDAAIASVPDVLQTMYYALGYGVAHESGLKFGIAPDIKADIAQRWMTKRKFAIESAIPSELISFSVDGY